jgi:leucyl-tRNA synthetase
MADDEKEGIDTGIKVTNPVSGESIPLWIADYVLSGYGTGCIMGVPAHDQRDFEFAKKYGLPIKPVIQSGDTAPRGDEMEAATPDYGTMINSGQFDGLVGDAGPAAVIAHLEKEKTGRAQTQYHLTDWLISRQRYWGCPIPVVHTPDGGVRPETELPVRLPEDVVVDGSGSPLKKMESFAKLAKGETRETDTFDTFFESSWYYARYCSADCDTAMLDERANYWLPVDQYVGGVEHAVLHLLYARFFHKLMRDEGLVECDEPFSRLLTQGMVVAETWYREGADGRRTWYNPVDVEVTRDDKGKLVGGVLNADGESVTFGGVEKMSKSKNNGVDPETLIERYGADTVRLYTMFTAPPDQSLEWSDEGVEGAARFLRRLWSLAAGTADAVRTAAGPDGADAATADARRDIHTALKKALFDYERRQYNTVVSACMTMVNVLYKLEADQPVQAAVLREGLGVVLRLLAPIAPHVTHHLWRELGFGDDVLTAGWPVVDEDALAQDSIQYVVQVNGKVRGKVQVAADAPREAIEAAALADYNVKRFTEGVTVRKVIVVPNKLVNVVAK